VSSTPRCKLSWDDEASNTPGQQANTHTLSLDPPPPHTHTSATKTKPFAAQVESARFAFENFARPQGMEGVRSVRDKFLASYLEPHIVSAE
jgi:hypothetical protein